MKISDDVMAAIAELMNDEARETVHNELSPCTNEEFLKRYIELDSDFETVLKMNLASSYSRAAASNRR